MAEVYSEKDEDADSYAYIMHCARLLPPWFTKRMMGDQWHFGLMLTTGRTLAISTIDRVVRDNTGALWLDVELLENKGAFWEGVFPKLVFSPTSRTKASVAVSQIVAAFELADT